MSKSSNTEKFVNLLVNNQKQLQAYILYQIPGKSDADDIYQETIVEMWNKFDSFEPDTNFSAWGCQIARYKIMNYQQKFANSKLTFKSETLELLEYTFRKNAKSGIEERLETLKGCITKLPQKEKTFISLRYEQDNTYEQIAKQFGVSINAVFKSLSKIHGILARCVRRTSRAGETL